MSISTARLLEKAAFLTSAAQVSQCPDDSGREVAFAGRSNAGKSSAINALTRQKKLAKTSKTPGRTQLINFFSLDEQRRIVDLPGYGYAKVSISMRDHWKKHLSEYLVERKSLAGIVLMMDIRHPMKDFDEMMLEWAEHFGMSVHVLLTKADKLKRGQANNSLMQVQKFLSEYNGEFSVQMFSAVKRTGLDEAYSVIGNWLDV